jgi:hypothetical protein
MGDAIAVGAEATIAVAPRASKNFMNYSTKQEKNEYFK